MQQLGVVHEQRPDRSQESETKCAYLCGNFQQFRRAHQLENNVSLRDPATWHDD